MTKKTTPEPAAPLKSPTGVPGLDEITGGPPHFTHQGIDAEQNRFLGEMLARVSDAVIANDLRERVTFLNAAAEQLYGVRACDVLGRGFADIYTRNWPAPEAEAAMWTALAEHGEWRGELIHHTHDGREIHVEKVITTLRGADGAPAGHVAAIRDITERKLVAVVVDMTEPLRTDEQLRTINEQLILGSVRLHELTAAEVSLNEQLRAEIAERNRAEMAVARLAAIVESSHDALFGEDIDGIITSWNRGAEQIFGYRAEEIVGTSIMRLIPADRQAAEHDLQRQIVAGHLGGNFESIRLTKEGREFPASISTAPLKDASGKVIGTSRSVRDITDRTRVQESLRQNAALFSALIAQAPMGTYVVDAQFRMQQINAEAMPVFASIQPLIGRDFQEIVEILWGSEVGGQIAGIFRHTLKTGERYVSPSFTQTRHDLGIEQSYEWETQRVTLPDGHHGVVCYFHEVTERARATAALRESELRTRLATEATQVGIWEWNIVTNQVRWDALMFRIYGVEPTPDGFVDYTDWSSAVLPEDLSENEAILQDTLRRCGRSDRTFRIRRRDDGECRDIAAVETVRTDAQGQAEWVVGTNLDITERNRAENELRRLAAELLHADRRKDEFLAILAHELRNPLAPLRTGLDMMRMSNFAPSTVQEASSIMGRQLKQMVRLVDDLMDVSRINSGKLVLRKERVTLASVMENALETSRPLIDQMGHVLTVNLPEEPVPVDVDLTRLAQVFSNLLNNAAKYTDRGGQIWLTAERIGSDVVVSVKDSGIGIAADQLPRVFEMFSQVNSSLGRAQGGLGIGLMLVRRLVEMHGGSIEARSDGPDKGSEFIVHLPIVVETPISRVVDEDEECGSKNSYRILVVDDNHDIAFTLAKLLEINGNITSVAYTGEEALATLAEFRPDVILLDIGLPGMNGYETCRHIREAPGSKQITIIAQSGWGGSDDKRKSKEVGFDHHLVKPVDMQALMKLLEDR